MATFGTKLMSSAGDPASSVISEPNPRFGERVFRFRQWVFVGTDLLGIWTGAALAIGIRFSAGSPFTSTHPLLTVPAHVGIVLLFSVLVVLFGYTQRLYSAYQLASPRFELLAIAKSISMAGLLLATSIYISGDRTVSRLVIIATASSAFLAMTSWRYFRRRAIRRATADGLTCYNVLIAGTDSLAQAVRRHLVQHRELGFVVLGFLSSDGRPYQMEPEEEDVRILGTINDLPAISRSSFVDEVIICAQDRQTMKDLIAVARSCGVGVRIIPDLYDGMASGAQLDYLGGFLTLTVQHKRIPFFEMKLKRMIDLVISAFVLVLISPIMLAIALAIRCDSAGPVLYISKRVGRKGQVFSCYKFRTMVKDADKRKAELEHLNERDNVLFKIKNDPRITRLGQVLRKYSLDEIPQLWNVLKGNMSLVGPRPPLAAEVEQYELEYFRRLEMTPGITGLWQVEARSSSSFDRYISLDLRYVENWSLGLDIKLLFRTIRVVIAGTGS